MKKKFIMIVSIISLLIIGLVGCSSRTETAQQTAATKVRVATQPGVYSAPVLLAKVNRYLEEELKDKQVQVVWTSFPSGPPMNEAFAAGEEDIGLIGDVPLLIAKASGQKTVAFAKTSSGEKTVALTVPPGSAIKNPADLKGKKVAFVKGSYGHHFLSLILTKGGLTLNDIQQVNLPNADVANAVTSHQVDAGIIWEPSLTSSVKNGSVNKLIDGTGIKSNNVFYFATESFAKGNPEILEAFIRAVDQANKFIAQNPQKAAELLQKELALPVEDLAALFSQYNYSPLIQDSDITELKQVEEFNRAQGFSTETVDVDAFIDKTFLKNSGVGK